MTSFKIKPLIDNSREIVSIRVDVQTESDSFHFDAKFKNASVNSATNAFLMYRSLSRQFKEQLSWSRCVVTVRDQASFIKKLGSVVLGTYLENAVKHDQGYAYYFELRAGRPPNKELTWDVYFVGMFGVKLLKLSTRHLETNPFRLVSEEFPFTERDKCATSKFTDSELVERVPVPYSFNICKE